MKAKQGTSRFSGVAPERAHIHDAEISRPLDLEGILAAMKASLLWSMPKWVIPAVDDVISPTTMIRISFQQAGESLDGAPELTSGPRANSDPLASRLEKIIRGKPLSWSRAASTSLGYLDGG